MGMFDSIKINAEKLPLSEEEKQLLKDQIFQTKDLEKCLLLYSISDEGELLLLHLLNKNDPNDPIPVFYTGDEYGDEINETLSYERIPFHGYLRFYNSINNSWYEFKAKFTDDKLVSIERVYDKR